MVRLSEVLRVICLSITLLVFASPSKATLMLTQAGIDAGFHLSTFVSGYQFGTYGPLSQAITTDGTVITGSAGDGNLYLFHDVDGQMLTDAVSKRSYSCQTANCNWALATAGGEVYGAQAFGGLYQHFAADGSFTPIGNSVQTDLRGNLGLWTNPANGHLIASSNRGLVEIDPVGGTYRVINGSLFPDGVSVSRDGTTAYVEHLGSVQSYSIATGALLKTFNTGHGPDGTGVINGGKFNGMVIVNNNDGTVGLLDPSKPDGDPGQFVIIASGGTRGDFVSEDPSNGTLFISQLEQVVRFSCGPDCSVGSAPPPDVPEPATPILFGTGLAAVVGLRRRLRAS